MKLNVSEKITLDSVIWAENLHKNVEFIWAETCIKNWRNTKTTWTPTAGWVSNRCLKNSISRVNHCLKHTTEDREKATHKPVNLPLMPGPCSTSHSSTAPEKKGRLKSTTATAPRSASLRECTAMATEPVLYCKSSPQTKYIERNYKFKPRHTPKLDFTFLSSVLKNCMLNVLLGIQMCKNTHRKSKSCIFAQS